MRRAKIVFLTLILAAALPGGAAARLDTGLFDVSAFLSGNPTYFERTRDVGARYVRLWLPWSVVAPADKPATGNPADPDDPHYHYQWGLVDESVRQTVKHGLIPVLSINSTPTWARAHDDCTVRDGTICAPQADEFANFAHAAALHYSGLAEGPPKVSYWQAWNEPNTHSFFHPQFENGRWVSPQIYRRMLNAFSRAVKRVDPDNIVIAGGTAPLTHPHVVPPLEFERRLLCIGGRQHPHPVCNARVHFDIWDTHPYTPGSPNHRCGRDEVCLSGLPGTRRVLRAAERAGNLQSDLNPALIWAMEFSWDSNPPDPNGVGLRTEARWASEAMWRMWREGVSAVFWLLVRDQPGHGRPPNIFQSGLYLRGNGLEADRPKPVFHSFRFPFVALPRGDHVLAWGRTPDSEPGEVEIQRDSASGWSTIKTLDASNSGVFRALLGTDPHGRARAVLLPGSYQERAHRSLPFEIREDRPVQVNVFGSGFTARWASGGFTARFAR